MMMCNFGFKKDKLMEIVTQIFGFVAASFTTGAFIPQAIKVYKTNSTADIALGTFLLFTFGTALWLIYGILIWSLPIIFANIISVCFACYILVKKIMNDVYKRKDS